MHNSKDLVVLSQQRPNNSTVKASWHRAMNSVNDIDGKESSENLVDDDELDERGASNDDESSVAIESLSGVRVNDN